jgi:hypothetical protein
MTNAYKYWYGGKPAGTQKIGTSYQRLEDSQWDPGVAGWESHLVYLNVEAASGDGYLRLRAMRADGDATGYMDFHINGPRLITYTYWEARGASDGPTFWQLKCIRGLKSATISTRYRKGCVVRK